MRSITYNQSNKFKHQKHCEDCNRRLRDENDVGVSMFKCHVCHQWYEDTPAVTSKVD